MWNNGFSWRPSRAPTLLSRRPGNTNAIQTFQTKNKRNNSARQVRQASTVLHLAKGETGCQRSRNVDAHLGGNSLDHSETKGRAPEKVPTQVERVNPAQRKHTMIAATWQCLRPKSNAQSVQLTVIVVRINATRCECCLVRHNLFWLMPAQNAKLF